MDPTLLSALAAELIEGSQLKGALAEIDARPVPDLVRAVHAQELLEAVFPKLWDQLVLQAQFEEQSVAAIRPALFAALCMTARARSHSQRLNLEWTRYGEQPEASSPATASHRDVGYVLLYDPSRETAVFLSGSSPTLFGRTWLWRGDAWQSRAVSEHEIPKPHNQGFSGFLDPSRDGIACWTLVPRQPGDFERYRPLGLLVRGEHIEVIDTSEPPVVPSHLPFAFGAIFGVDPASDETILLARDGLYALRAGQWVSLCALEPSITSKEWSPATRAAFTHRDRLYFTWTDTDNFSRRCRLLRFTGQGVQEVTAAHAPLGGWDAALSDSTGACFLSNRAMWRLEGSSDALTWQQVESAPVWPKLSACHGAVLPDGSVLVGPGQFEGGRASRYQRWLFHARGSKVTLLGEVREGVGAIAADRTLLGLDDRVLAVYADGRVECVRGERVTRLAEAQPDLALTLAGIGLDGQGHVMAVASDAAMWRLEANGWQRVGEPEAQVAAWTIVCCAWDPPRGRLVIWGFRGDPNSRNSERTAVWSNGRWTRLEAGSTLPVGERDPHANLDNQLVFDTHLQALVFVGSQSVCVLSEDRWHPATPDANVDRGVSVGAALLVHDQDSATTLLINTKDGWCGRLDGGQLTPAATLRATPDRLDTYFGTGRARRAAMVYVPASRSVILFASGKSFSQLWELPLAEVFAKSVKAEERKPFPKQDPNARRFPGPVLRRLVDLSESPAPASSNVTRFRRFGEEPPADWPLPTQTADEPLLVFDGLRQRWVLLRVAPDAIECWEKRAASWQLLHRSENLVPWSATVRLSGDPQRGAVLWCVNEAHGTFGYQITDQELAPIETSGDGPLLSATPTHRNKVAFVWDRRDERLLGFSAEGLWALSDDHRWSRLASWDGATPLHAVAWFRRGDGGAWDAGSQRLVLWKLDSSHGLRCWAVTATGITALEQASLVELKSGVLAESDQGLLLFDLEARSLRRLEDTKWVAVEPGRDAPALVSFGNHVMACHGDSLELVSDSPFQFHSLEHGQWTTQGQPVGVTRPNGTEYLGRHRGQLFAATTLAAWVFDGSHWQAAPNLMESLISVPWRDEVEVGGAILGVTSGEGPVRVLSDCGSIGELTEQGWALQRPHGDLPMRSGYFLRTAARCPHDGSWLLVLHSLNDALTFRGTSDGAWSQVCSLPPNERIAPYSSRKMVFDTRLGCFILVGTEGLLHLRDDAWAVAELAALPEFDMLVHDPGTGVTLLVELSQGKVYQLGESTCTELHGVIGPPLPTRQRAISNMNSYKCAFDVDGRRLLWFDTNDVWGNYELDLSPFFEQGRARDGH